MNQQAKTAEMFPQPDFFQLMFILLLFSSCWLRLVLQRRLSALLMELRKQTTLTRWRKDVVSCYTMVFKMEPGIFSFVRPDRKHCFLSHFQLREFIRVK